MTLPSKNVKTHILITYAGTKHFLTAEQELSLRGMADSDRVYTEKGMVRVNTIKEILPVDEYYLEHPEQRPVINSGPTTFPPTMPYSQTRHRRALDNMRRGFTGYFTGREMPKKAKKILENFDRAIKRLDTISPGKIFQ